ncbi:XRE family transcriptional regulator [Pararobbsia alpina]|uniref:helix-turn-helix domain-containing protein n=1 Tax=Pararobbsia alpina TaxID=621374 RepID=UPI0039A42200
MAHPIHDRRYQLVASELAAIRKERGLLQIDVAERLRRPQAYVSKVESGVRRVDLIELIDFLAALEMEPKAFLDRILE